LKAKPRRSLWKNDKLPILILVERGGLELYIPSIDVRGETIGRIASRHVEQGSRIYTDGFPFYIILQSLGFSHEWVNNSEDEYARRDVHVNNCENRASLLRPWLGCPQRSIQG